MMRNEGRNIVEDLHLRSYGVEGFFGIAIREDRDL